MTDEVAALVLADNEAQANALEIAAVEARDLVGVHARQMERLEQTGILDRALEALPDAKALQERHAARRRAHRAGARGAARVHQARAAARSSSRPTCPTTRTSDASSSPTSRAAARAVRRSRRRAPAPARDRRHGRRQRGRQPRRDQLPVAAGRRDRDSLPTLARAHVSRRDVFDGADAVVGDRRARPRRAGRGAGRDVPRGPAARRAGGALVGRGTATTSRSGRRSNASGPAVERSSTRCPSSSRGTAAESLRARPRSSCRRCSRADLPCRVAGARGRARRVAGRPTWPPRAASTSTSRPDPLRLADRLGLDWLRDHIAALPRPTAGRPRPVPRCATTSRICQRALTETVLAIRCERSDGMARRVASRRTPPRSRYARCSTKIEPAVSSTSRTLDRGSPRAARRASSTATAVARLNASSQCGRRQSPRGRRSRRTRRAPRHRGAPTPTRGTGRGPASRPGRARAPAGTRAAARTPSCRRRARRRRGWRCAPRARAAAGGGGR